MDVSDRAISRTLPDTAGTGSYIPYTYGTHAPESDPLTDSRRGTPVFDVFCSAPIEPRASTLGKVSTTDNH
jgi:hypothetical protein